MRNGVMQNLRSLIAVFYKLNWDHSMTFKKWFVFTWKKIKTSIGTPSTKFCSNSLLCHSTAKIILMSFKALTKCVLNSKDALKTENFQRLSILSTWILVLHSLKMLFLWMSCWSMDLTCCLASCTGWTRSPCLICVRAVRFHTCKRLLIG